MSTTEIRKRFGQEQMEWLMAGQGLIFLILLAAVFLSVLLPGVMIGVAGAWGAFTTVAILNDARREGGSIVFGLKIAAFYNVPTLLVFMITYVRW